MKTVYIVSKTVEHIETFTFNRELSVEEQALLSRGNIPNFNELEERCDEYEERELDSSNKGGYDILILHDND